MNKTDISLYKGYATYEGDEVMMHRYSPEIKKGDGAVIIFPGGGYNHLAPHEGEPYALMLNEMGIEAFVVEYRVAPNRYPAPLSDARRAVQIVSENADTWQINPNKIAVMGSSAGGHLAALVTTSKDYIGWSKSAVDEPIYFPNAQILCYPVTDPTSHMGSYENLLGDEYGLRATSVNPINIIEEDTAVPTFIWHTSSDLCVDVKGSYKYATRLSELGAAVEMHIYPVGGHGLGLANGLYSRGREPYVQRWTEDLCRWLKHIGWINE